MSGIAFNFPGREAEKAAASATFIGGYDADHIPRALRTDAHGRLLAGAQTASASRVITRPSNTTAYAAGDVIGDTGGSAIHELANAGPAGGMVVLTKFLLAIGLSAVPSGMAGFTVHFYNASPTAIADNAAFDLVAADVGKYLGSMALGAATDRGAILIASALERTMTLQLADGSTSLFFELVTDAAFTPASATLYTATADFLAV